jgi:hypothetical protein
MTPTQFRHRLRAYGPDLERWPDAEQARDLLATSAPTRRRFLAALAHDPSLDAPVDPAVLARLAARTSLDVAQAPRTARTGRSIILSLQWSALAACALLGIWAGMPDTDGAQPGTTVLASLQITALDPPWPDSGP